MCQSSRRYWILFWPKLKYCAPAESGVVARAANTPTRGPRRGNQRAALPVMQAFLGERLHARPPPPSVHANRPAQLALGDPDQDREAAHHLAEDGVGPVEVGLRAQVCLLYTSPSPRDS